MIGSTHLYKKNETKESTAIKTVFHLFTFSLGLSMKDESDFYPRIVQVPFFLSLDLHYLINDFDISKVVYRTLVVNVTDFSSMEVTLSTRFRVNHLSPYHHPSLPCRRFVSKV